MDKHHPRMYATIRKVNGHAQVVYAFSCGPCRVYGRLFRTEQGRLVLAREHGVS